MFKMVKYFFAVLPEIIKFPTLEINLQCDSSGCEDMYRWLTKRHPRYFIIKHKTFGMELIDLQRFKSFNDYLTACSGKNSAAYYKRKAERTGYSFKKIIPTLYRDAIYEINTSLEQRQGMEMELSYKNKDLEYPDNHHNQYYGVFLNDKLVAYMWIFIYGEWTNITRLLGHGNYLKDGIMYFMITCAIKDIMENYPSARYLMYDTFFVSPGLRLFKKRLGFNPYKVKWRLQ